jgi:peroxidase
MRFTFQNRSSPFDHGSMIWTPQAELSASSSSKHECGRGKDHPLDWIVPNLYSAWCLPDPSSEPSPKIVARPEDGFGTNLHQPGWGATGAKLLRLSVDTRGPRGEMAGADRPNAREISNAVAQQDVDTANAAGASDFLWIWGQFLDHDMSLTEAGQRESADIEIPAGDPYFDPLGTGAVTMPFSRVDASEGGYSNQITAYIDASMIYGSDGATVQSMRVDGGKLLMTEEAQLALEGANLVTGDVRAAENLALSSMHTIFTREHNRLVDDLAAAYPTLTGDELFDAARARVEAIIQAITFNNFLPILLGETALSAYTGFDDTVNAGISVEFSTAVYRLGHTLLSSRLQKVSEDGTVLEPLALRDAFFRPTLLQESGTIEAILRGAATQTAQALDTLVVEDVRSFLFGPPGAGGFDLAALNIQRGRDLGVASYNEMRDAVGLARAESFADLTSDADLAARLEAVYEKIDLVDAWVGGLAEDPLDGALVGETFLAIMVDQFTRLRDGDAYWSEGRIGFTDAERADLWSTSLADVILRNTDIEVIQTNVFTAMTRTIGTDRRDVLKGDADNNFIFGADGHDILRGYRGDDDLQGGNGKDKLIGGAGSDVLSGGNGRDTFVFHARDSGHDTITDFDLGLDKLVIRAANWRKIDVSEVGADVVLALGAESSIKLVGLADDVDAHLSWHDIL